MNYLVNVIGSCTAILSIAACGFVLIKDRGTRINIPNMDKGWNLLTWICGIFISGMGVALVLKVPADLNYYINDMGFSTNKSTFTVAMLNGIPVWAIYSILGYWYMHHMDNKIGKLAAILSTVLGMSISLYTGVTAIEGMFGSSTVHGVGFVIAFFMVSISLLSARFNLLKHVSRIATYMFVLCFLILITVDSVSPRIANTSTDNIDVLFELLFGDWSASYWFWYISWAPTVARWFAHISNGRTVRQYVLGTVLLPTLFCSLWILAVSNYNEYISNLTFSINNLIPALLFALTGIMFMSGTLDSDCKVFTEDLEALSGGTLKSKSMIPYYGIFVMGLTCVYLSGNVPDAFAINKYSSIIFIPLMLIAVIYGFGLRLKKNGDSSSTPTGTANVTDARINSVLTFARDN